MTPHISKLLCLYQHILPTYWQREELVCLARLKWGARLWFETSFHIFYKCYNVIECLTLPNLPYWIHLHNLNSKHYIHFEGMHCTTIERNLNKSKSSANTDICRHLKCGFCFIKVLVSTLHCICFMLLCAKCLSIYRPHFTPLSRTFDTFKSCKHS